MKNLKSTFAVLSLSVGIVSAATNVSMPNWSVKSIPTSVALVSTFKLVNGNNTEDAIPTVLLDLNGVRYAFRYTGAKQIGWYTMAMDALTQGKKIGVYSDSDYLLSMVSCGDFNSDDKCTLLNTNTPHAKVQNLVVEP